jgi:N-acetyl-gamma-glutamyl-phosphate reductase
MNKIKVGIIGGAGYTGGELLRILVNHPTVEIAFVNSKSQAGKPLYATHSDLLGETDLLFSDETQGADVLFLCSGHGESKKFLAQNQLDANTKIIDLSTDFRDQSEGFVYGLPELQRESIKNATKIANPGCFATCIQLGLLPLAQAGLLKDDIHVSAITGSTGAGQALSNTTHFSWRNNNVSIYKAFNHQHLTEIGMNLVGLQPSFENAVNFIPYRGNFSRGIMANTYTKFDGTLAEAIKLYKDFYANHPFTHISEATEIDVKQVVNTNKCFVHLQKNGNNLLISSVIDNLLKGASGQAVQNMNLAFGLEETTGLRLKAIGF